MIVRFADIGGNVDHYCLEKLVRFGDIDEIVDHHCLEKLVRSADIGTIFTYFWQGLIIDGGVVCLLFAVNIALPPAYHNGI